MIRSSKVTLRFANKAKREQVSSLISEYTKVVSSVIDVIWDMEYCPKFLSKNITSHIDTWLSARMIQCAGKQACAIVACTKKKHGQRLYRLKSLLDSGETNKAQKLQSVLDKNQISKPVVCNLEPELDSRFIKIDWNSETSFDGWITIGSIGSGMKIVIPIKRTKHLNKLTSDGDIKQGIRLSCKFITFNISISVHAPILTGQTVGLDVGAKSVYSLSTGDQSKQDIHGHTLDSILKKMSRKKKGSIAFQKAADHRKNHINWSLNKINLKDIKKIRIEKIRDMRKSVRSSRYLSHWTYTVLFDKLHSLCERAGVQIEEVECAYTSQRCSRCGWVRKTNRSGKVFRCTTCGYVCDADLNAASNISLELPILDIEKIRRLHESKSGFYWNVAGQEPIVPVIQRTDNSFHDYL